MNENVKILIELQKTLRVVVFFLPRGEYDSFIAKTLRIFHNFSKFFEISAILDQLFLMLLMFQIQRN